MNPPCCQFFMEDFLWNSQLEKYMLNYKIILLLLSSVVMTACSVRQTENYEAEADAFLKQMPAGLQDKQCAAIRQAMAGDNTALMAVRNGRNAKTVLSEKVEIREISPQLRLYVPREKQNKPLPLLVYLHGGGWTFGSINSCARYCSELTATGSVIVLAVDYRLAPEHPYPAGLDDCVAAIEYAREHAAEWGSAPQLISVGGDSSGGNLALTATLRLFREGQPLPRSLVLYYPVVSAWNDSSASWKQYATGQALDGDIMEAFNQAYCEGVNKSIHEDAKANALISPSVSSDEELSHLPKILLIAAERDILHDQGQLFAERLQSLGVNIHRKVFSGSVHLFITVPGQEKAFRKAISEAETFLNE